MGLLAVCVQHEMDHLKGQGIRRIPLSMLKQTRIKSRMRKLDRDSA